MKCKRESPNFAIWDAHGIAAHLEAMERRGWQFRGTDWLGRWEYIPCEKKAVRYAVAYAPSRRGYRITPTDAERDLEDICFDAGWRKLAALSSFHIYRNPDPDATDLETDELTRLDTLHRSLGKSLLTNALLWIFLGLTIIGILVWSIFDHLPRALATPMLLFSIVFSLSAMANAMIPYLMYRFWLKKARLAAQSGLPCPPVRGLQLFNHINWFFTLPLLLWLVIGGALVPLLIYMGILLVFWFLRWVLEHKVQDHAFAEDAWQVLLVILFICFFCFHRWNSNRLQPDTLETTTLPLMAQDLMDTTGLELTQFHLEAKDAPLASYHRYWQASDGLGIDLQYTVFDLHVPFLEDACREPFLETFDYVTQRDGMTISPADPTLWGAESVLYSTKDGNDQWLIFYEDRTVHLHTNWNMTDDEITAAAVKLAP